MPQGRLLRQDDITQDSIKATAQKKLDKGTFQALTGEHGVLPAGALPSVKAANEQGQKAVLAALDDDKGPIVKAKAKAKAKAKEEAEKVEPKTVQELGSQRFRAFYYVNPISS